MTLTRLTQNDWEELLPEHDRVLGKTHLPISPLTIGSLTRFTSRIVSLYREATKVGIDFSDEEKLPEIFEFIADKAPDLLELASGLHRDDIVNLPVSKGVELLNAVIKANIKSREDLAKNFKALGDLLGLTEKEAGESRKPSNS